MPHEWLRQHVSHYEEVEVDHRAKDEALRSLKRGIRLKPDKVQCQKMRKALPELPGLEQIRGAVATG